MSLIQTRPISGAVGVDVLHVDIRQPLSESVRAEIHKLWGQHLVLRFRDQPLNDPELLAFSRALGDLEPPGPNPQGKPYLPEFPELNVISNIKQGDAHIGGLGDGEAIWHSDMTYAQRVPKGAVLHSIEVPPAGGNTYWSNLYLAYEQLPVHLRGAVAGRNAIHDSTYNSAGIMRIGMKPVTDVREAPGAHHPLVVRHPGSGRPILFLGRRRNSYILGLPIDESEALLDELWAHATRPEFTMEQVWKVGDTIVWDNFGTLHRRDAFDPHSRRLMHRAQIRGSTPLAFAEAA
jgi:taurine dioxygenase